MSIETGIRCDAWRPNQVMIASQAQASTMIAAPTMVPTIRPGLRLRMVWLMNICSWVRHSSSPTPRPLATRVRGLAFETTQHRADVLLATAGQVEEDLLQRLPVLSDHVSELLQAAHGDQPTVVDDGQPGAHPLGDLQDVGGEEHRLPLPAEVLEDVFHLPGALRIEAHRGLVEEEHLGVVQEGRGERDFLAHAPRVAGQKVIGPLVPVEELEQRLDPAITQPSLDVIEVPGKFQEFARTELVVEGCGVGEEAALNSARIGAVAARPQQVFRRYSVVALKVEPYL